MLTNPLNGITARRRWPAALMLALGATVASATPHLGDESVVEAGPYGTSGPGWGDAQFGNDQVQVEARAGFAGALGSLRHNGMEYLNIDDHGRQMQMAVSLDPRPECLMPTEAGSAADGSGPTSSSRLIAAQVGPGTWETSTNAAYWLTGTCTQETFAPDLFTKQVQVGVPGNAKVIRYAGQMQLVRTYPQVYAEIPTAYLRSPFTALYRIDPQSGDTWKIRTFNTWPNGEEDSNNVPVIFATADGAHAIGLWSPSENQGDNFRYRAHRFDFSPIFGNHDRDTYKMTVTRSWGTNVPQRVDNLSYFAVGTLNSVRLSLMQLYAQQPTHVSRNWGTPDRREGDKLPPPTQDPGPGPGTPVTTLSSFDQASPDVETGNRVKQVGVSSSGTKLIQRFYDNGWTSWNAGDTVNASGLAAIRSFSQGPDAENRPKQYFVNRAGDTIYSRTFSNGRWGEMRQASVASLGIAGVSKIRSFDRAGPDAAIGNVLKDIVVSDDGRTQYYRKFDKGTQTWSSWISGSISGIGIAGLTTAKSLSQSVTPEGYPKFHLLSGDGTVIYTRTMIGGVWQPWSSVLVSALGMTE